MAWIQGAAVSSPTENAHACDAAACHTSPPPRRDEELCCSTILHSCYTFMQTDPINIPVKWNTSCHDRRRRVRICWGNTLGKEGTASGCGLTVEEFVPGVFVSVLPTRLPSPTVCCVRKIVSRDTDRFVVIPVYGACPFLVPGEGSPWWQCRCCRCRRFFWRNFLFCHLVVP